MKLDFDSVMTMGTGGAESGTGDAPRGKPVKKSAHRKYGRADDEKPVSGPVPDPELAAKLHGEAKVTAEEVRPPALPARGDKDHRGEV